MFFRKAKLLPAPTEQPSVDDKPRRKALFSTHDEDEDGATNNRHLLSEYVERLKNQRPLPALREGQTADAMDAADSESEYETVKGYTYGQPGIDAPLVNWYTMQSFIGWQLAGIVAQHWLVAKICAMPARDAIRNGFDIVNIDGEDIDKKIIRRMKVLDKQYGLRRNLLEFVTKGRIFGIRICMFKVDYGDADTTIKAYEAPFNIDGVKPGTYKGMVQVDPYWCAPELDAEASAKPDSMHFYEPTWWLINGKRYHRSHLVIYRHGDVVDILKPAYLYGGIPVPQLVMERVYGAERTANEAPLLALTKRTVVYKVDLAKALTNFKKFSERVWKWATFWNNNGIRVIDKEEDEIEQIDTSLSDMDAIIMTQYQLAAAAGDVPSTKLLGTAPKGFNATGEFDESSYHETLESLQEHEMTPLVDRHHLLSLKSNMPEVGNLMTTVSWLPLDSPTALELAQTNLAKSQTGYQLVQSGAIDGVDERARVSADKDSGYAGLNAIAESFTPPMDNAPADTNTQPVQ